MTVFHPAFVGVLLALTLCACSENHSESATRRDADAKQVKTPEFAYRVAETFDVGEGVYVRSLAVDSKNNTLWVGTSAGVLMVDVASGNAKGTYTRDDGLANEYVFAIHVDNMGDTWFGTNGGGVSRQHDGQWRTFFPMHGLADYWVYAFAEQSDGTLWIGTWAGLNRYDPKSGTFRTYLKELVNEWIYGLSVDSRDRVWVGTEGGINMFDGQTWTTWTHADGLGAPNSENLPFSPNTGLGTRSRHDLNVQVDGKPTYNPNYVFDILVSADDTVWAGTWGGGVSHYNGQRWRNYTRQDGVAGNIVYAVAEDPDHGLWFGTNGGLAHLFDDRWETIKDGLPDLNVYAVAVSPDGQVWAGTRGGVVRIAKNSAP